MVIPLEEVTVKGKEKPQLHIQVIDSEDPEEEQQQDDAPKSTTSESPHEVPSQITLDVPMSPFDTDVDSFSTVHIAPVPLSVFAQNVIPISALEPSLDHPHEDLSNIFHENPVYVSLPSLSLAEIDTTATNFEKFLMESPHPLLVEQAMIVVQTETSPRVTTVIRIEHVSSSPPTISETNSMALPPWLSSFTPKRKKQEISPNIFDFQQLKKSKPKAAKRAKTVSRVIVDSNRIKVAAIVEPIVDNPHEEMQSFRLQNQKGGTW